MSKLIEAQKPRNLEVKTTPKGPHSEKMTVFLGKGAALKLDVISLKPSLRPNRITSERLSQNNDCPVESNVSCPDASCPDSSCRVENTKPEAHTCAGSCVLCG